MGRNDLDLRTGDLCVSSVVLWYQAEYVLLNLNQKYGTTIAYLKKASAFL